MSTWSGIAAASGGLIAAGCVGAVTRPTAQLAPRVRPYLVPTRAALGLPTDLRSVPPAARAGGALRQLLGPALRSLGIRVGRLVERRSDDDIRLVLRHAGLEALDVHEYRVRSSAQAALGGLLGSGVGLAVHSLVVALGLALCGAVWGGTRARARVDRGLALRREQMRLELATVNQILAVHIRTGAGPVQAMQRVVERGRGVVIEELALVLARVRSGVSEPEALRRAAELTPEPIAARTYRLLAVGSERGVDLATSLRALTDDILDARREEVRMTATRRRAAMLVPTIAVLAPVMLLFVAAPLPSIVLGSR